MADHSNGPRRGHLYILTTGLSSPDDPRDIMFLRSTNDGETWSSPVRVNDDPLDAHVWQWFGLMSVAPSGRIDVVWNDTRKSRASNLCEVYYAFSIDEGVSWSKNVAVSPAFNSHLGWPNQNKIGDYYHMISDELGANVAYAATFNAEQDVYFLRIAPDCNENGAHDGDDIAAGRSQDANGDGLPDEGEGVECERIARFKVRCRRGKLKTTVRSSLPEGTPLTINNNGQRSVMILDWNGRGELDWQGQRGGHTVFIEECQNRVRAVQCERVGVPVSGVIRTSAGHPLPGTRITVDEYRRDRTDATGFYRFYMPVGWSGTVRPERDRYEFDPPSREYWNLKSERAHEDYTDNGEVLIQGHVRDLNGKGVENVRVEANNGGGFDVTSPSGYYRLTVPDGWSGRVTPTHQAYTFDPLWKTYDNLPPDQLDQDLVALPCWGISEITSKCKRGVLRCVLTTDFPPGTRVTVVNDQQPPVTVEIDSSGIGKAKWSNPVPGRHRVCVGGCEKACARAVCP